MGGAEGGLSKQSLGQVSWCLFPGGSGPFVTRLSKTNAGASPNPSPRSGGAQHPPPRALASLCGGRPAPEEQTQLKTTIKWGGGWGEVET